MTVTPTTVRPQPPGAGVSAGPPSGPPSRRPGSGRGTRPWWLLAPALAVLGVLLLWPLIRVVAVSMQEFGLRQLLSGEVLWIGLANYQEMFADPFLWRTALPNTVVFAAVCVLLTVVVGTRWRCCSTGGPGLAGHRHHGGDGGLGGAGGHRHVRLDLRLRPQRGRAHARAGRDRRPRPGHRQPVHQPAVVLCDRDAQRRAPRVPVRRGHRARRTADGAARDHRGGDRRRRRVPGVGSGRSRCRCSSRCSRW